MSLVGVIIVTVIVIVVAVDSINSTFLLSVHRSFVPFRIDQTKTKFMLKTETHQFGLALQRCARALQQTRFSLECVFACFVFRLLALDDRLTDWAG